MLNKSNNNARPVLLQVKDISKKFGDFYANDTVNLAIETGKVHTVGIRGGKKIAETTRYTDFWIKIQGKWLLLAEHSSFITNP